MNGKIDYVYFDVDNRRIVKSLEELKKIYFKGIKNVYECVYPHYPSGQVLHAMSSNDENETTLRIKLYRMRMDIAKKQINSYPY